MFAKPPVFAQAVCLRHSHKASSPANMRAFRGFSRRILTVSLEACSFGLLTGLLLYCAPGVSHSLGPYDEQLEPLNFQTSQMYPDWCRENAVPAKD